jgi:hypothetical protein
VDYAIKIGITRKGREYCPGLNSAGTPLIKLAEWKKLGAEALLDMAKYSELAEEWNRAVQDGTVEGTVKEFLKFVRQHSST